MSQFDLTTTRRDSTSTAISRLRSDTTMLSEEFDAAIEAKLDTPALEDRLKGY